MKIKHMKDIINIQLKLRTTLYNNLQQLGTLKFQLVQNNIILEWY